MDRTCRILCLFDVFYTCKIVSFRDINETMEYYKFRTCRKTIYRDIQLLKKADILRIRYSKKMEAYIPADGDINYGFCIGDFSHPELPEEKNQRLYMERVIRLCKVMKQVVRSEIKDPIGWYRRNYPDLSDRTRQRDFKLLQRVGYVVTYVPEDEEGPGGYYYEYPGRGLEPPKWLREQERRKA